LKEITLGVIKSYSYTESIDQYIQKYKDDDRYIRFISGDSVLQHNFARLGKGHIDALIEDKYVINYHPMQNNFKNPFKVISIDIPAKVFIVFAPNCSKSKAYAKILSEGILRLRKSGRLKQILSKYGLKD